MRKNILSADGGGIRGIITIRILEEIEKRSGKRIFELFDFCVGSSIATILISGLFCSDPADPTKALYSAEEIKNIIIKNGKKIFTTTYFRDVTNLWGLRGPKYSHKSLRLVIEDILGKHTTYGDLLKPCLFPVRDTLSGDDIYVYNRDVPVDIKNTHRINAKNTNLSTLLCGTTAAPIYFPSQEITIGNRLYNLIDSGTVVNDGCELALLECETLFGTDRNNIYEISITGRMDNNYNSSSWGLYDWASSIIGLFIDGNNKNQEYELSLIMGNIYKHNYHRLNPTIPLNINYIDRPEYIDQYIKITEKWIDNNNDLINEIVKKLLK